MTLRSADPHDAPAIVSGHLTDPADFVPLMRGVRLLRRVFATAPLQALVAAEMQPGDAVQDDAALQEYVRSNANSLFHAVGTCAMARDARAVTTPELRVRGVDGLRVVDASVMPTIPSGNTCAPVLMVAEKAADLILGRRVAPDAAGAPAARAA